LLVLAQDGSIVVSEGVFLTKLTRRGQQNTPYNIICWYNFVCNTNTVLRYGWFDLMVVPFLCTWLVCLV